MQTQGVFSFRKGIGCRTFEESQRTARGDSRPTSEEICPAPKGIPKAFVALLSGILCLCGVRESTANIISSPDGNVVASVTVASGQLVYSVNYRGVTMIETSPLGVTLNNTNLGTNVIITGSSAYSTNETFVSRHGIHSTALNQYQAQSVAVRHPASGVSYVLNARVYNNGVAFRYEFADESAKNITAESSGFVIPVNSIVWSQTVTSDYQGIYRGSNIIAMVTNAIMGPPVTIQLPGTNGFVVLTESVLGVFGNPYLKKVADATGRLLQVAYPVNVAGDVGASVIGPVNTPWNVIMIGADLHAIINNDIVESLAPAPDANLFPDGAATSWATMGRSVWDYLQPQPGGITYTNAMTNSLWASRLGFEYNTIDEGWANWNGGNPWAQVQQVADYSHALGVKILLWVTSSALNSPSQRSAFFQNLQTYGADGFKADFFDFNSKSASARERIKLQEDILREAATYHLVVNFHGTSKPSGQFRTYPNLLEMEAIFGKEQYPNPWMVSTIPFFRFMAGPADFTPLEFGGNIAFEIANVINMPGPIITFAQRSDSIANSAFASLIRTIPSEWDETIVLSQSQLGQTTATARRKGLDWYIGIINSSVTQSWNIPLTFLPTNVTFQADIVRENSTVLERTTVTRNSIFSVAVTTTNGSGFVAKLYQPPVFSLGANYLLSGTIIGTSGSWGGSGNTRDKVFDGNLSTFFDGPDSNGDWAGLDLGAGNQKIVSTIRYCPRVSWAGRMVGGVFQGANAADFSDAVTLWTVGYCPSEGSYTTVAIAKNVAYRYLRYVSPPGGWCNVAEVQFYGATQPQAPSGLKAMPGTDSVALTWNQSANATGYNVKRSILSAGPFVTIVSNTPALSYSDTGVLNGKPYYYVVSALTAGVESTNSAAASAAAAGSPESPEGVRAVAGTNQAVALAWSACPGATSYNVKRSISFNGPFTTVATPAGASYTDTSPANGTVYFYVISAVNAAGESADSSVVSATPGSYMSWVLIAAPAAYWRLAETSGAVALDSMGDNDGLYSGGCTLGVSGPAGDGFGDSHTAVYFDGNSAYTQVPLVIGATNFTIALWVKTKTTGGTSQWYNGKGLVDGEVNGLTNDFGTALVGGKFAFGVGNPDTTLTSVKTINDGLWHFLVATRDSKTGVMKIYVDGVLDNSLTGPTGSRTSPPCLRIGSIQAGAAYFGGSICEVALFNRVLDAEVSQIYRAAAGLFYNVALTTSQKDTTLEISWPGGGKLLESTNVTGPWITNSSATSPFVVTPSASQKFYRIQVQ